MVTVSSSLGSPGSQRERSATSSVLSGGYASVRTVSGEQGVGDTAEPDCSCGYNGAGNQP